VGALVWPADQHSQPGDHGGLQQVRRGSWLMTHHFPHCSACIRRWPEALEPLDVLTSRTLESDPNTSSQHCGRTYTKHSVCATPHPVLIAYRYSGQHVSTSLTLSATGRPGATLTHKVSTSSSCSQRFMRPNSALTPYVCNLTYVQLIMMHAIRCSRSRSAIHCAVCLTPPPHPGKPRLRIHLSLTE
jgi:hypothetical protein